MHIVLKKLIISLSFIFFGFVNTISAQSKDADVKDSYFKGSLTYLSNSVYNGRKDSLKTPYVIPALGYYDKSGFYTNGSLSYLVSAAEKRIDLFALEVGYNFDITTQLSGGIYVNKYFYNKSSTNVQSDIKGALGGNLSYDFGPIQFSAGADVVFANKTDFALNGGIAHAFYIGEGDNQWTINPSVTANMSTLNFYEGYTNRRAGKNAQKANGNGATVTTTTAVTNRSTGLTLLDYELSIPISYDAEKWGCSFTPTLASPQNPIYTTTTTTLTPRIGNPISATGNSTPPSEKTLSTTFYAEVGIYFKF